ncbi:MAG: hypothetical protein IMZ51_03810 [Chloroflexi bacterium]|nr:hypothetical protein [Chloroflexota bacterium]
MDNDKLENEKKERRIKYKLIRMFRPDISLRKARIFRDWTRNKIIMICFKEANPVR